MNTPLKDTEIIHEAVGVFQGPDELQAAMDDLQEHGFMRQEISILASDKVVEEKLGHIYRRVEEAEDDAAAPRTVFVSNETLGEAEAALVGVPFYLGAMAATGAVVASGGTLLTVLLAAGAAGGAGAAIGALLARRVGQHHADFIQEQLDHGGLLLWVHLRSAEKAELAKEILERHSGRDIHFHDVKL
ncbi:hypothetical protein ACFO5Q_03280 [Kordiimonas lipolytica]|uniref:General stress protein 17M-like domain-containing protein n=1 Tax=Kordiimonas lipolytica TaxID=1662421 RepID=A0ABV8U7U4_9PROT|nr:hypothetical protein [Kordiimonas lipolytica]